MQITVFGTGYVGLVTGACLADAGHEVTRVAVDQAKIDGLKTGVIPIYEPSLEPRFSPAGQRFSRSFGIGTCHRGLDP